MTPTPGAAAPGPPQPATLAVGAVGTLDAESEPGTDGAGWPGQQLMVRWNPSASWPAGWPWWPAVVAGRRDACLLVLGFAGAFRRPSRPAWTSDDVRPHGSDGLHVTVRTDTLISDTAPATPADAQ